MRVVVAAAGQGRPDFVGSVHPATAAALAEYAPEAEVRYVGGDELAYWGLLGELWADAEPFVLIEHDVEIDGATLAQLESCPELRCAFPYLLRSDELTTAPWCEAWAEALLGCVRFSGELIRAHPDAVTAIPAAGRQWKVLDVRLAAQLRRRGVTTHRHSPAVRHHHRGAWA